MEDQEAFMDGERVGRRNIFQYIMDPRTVVHRYIALLFICMLGFGNYYCYDTPGSLESYIEESMSIDTSQFTSLYALYSWPNVFICFFGGVMIDKVLGFRLGSIIFLVLLIIGQVMFAFGALWSQFWVMQLGRFVYGLGGELLTVTQNTYVVAWFKGRELNTVFGLQITVSRAGSALAYNTMHIVFTSFKEKYPLRDALGYALLFAAGTCVISFFAALILALQDKRAERILDRPVIISEDKISLKDATNFKSEFWILSVICVTFYLTIFPFIAIGARFFARKWGPDRAEALDSLVYAISAFLSPFIGMSVDKYGKNIVFLLVASVLVFISHMILGLTAIAPIAPMILLGLGYSIMCCAIWPLVALAVPENQLGTAYGVMQAIQNLGLAVTSNVTGYLVDWKGYITVEMFFAFWVSTSVISSVVLLVVNEKNRGVLNMSASERKRLETFSQ